MLELGIAVLAIVAWVYLALGRGGFWLGRQDDLEDPGSSRAAGFRGPWPGVAAIVPARNEAPLIRSTVGSLLAQTYPGRLSVTVIDDDSGDATAANAAAAQGPAIAGRTLDVVAGTPLPPEWTGKLWAVAQGIERLDLDGDAAEYLWLADADVEFDDDVLATLVARAASEGLVLSSLMVELRCESLAERSLVPAFVFFFQMIYPFAWVNDPARKTAAAAGGCMLVRRDALRLAGGIGAIRSEIIDDCALARRLKKEGPIRLALTARARSLRPCPTLQEVRSMVVRTAFAELHYSTMNLLLVAVAMLAVFVAPLWLASAAHDGARLLGALAWALMVVLYAPIARRYDVSVFWGVALPLIAGIYLLLTLESAAQHWRGRGGAWKGRSRQRRAVPAGDI